MKKYVLLRCDTCAREKTEALDLTHVKPDKCTITLACLGRLYPVQNVSSNTKKTSQTVQGLSNWQSRFNVQHNAVQLEQDSFYITNNGESNYLILAVPEQFSFPIADTATVKMVLSGAKEQREFNQYTYTKDTVFSIINGVESGVAKKVLKYSAANEVQVYLNGVKQIPGVNYLLYNSSSTDVPPNSVKFISELSSNINEIVIVVSSGAVLNDVEIVFNRTINDESILNNPWNNVRSIESPSIQTNSIFYCDFNAVSASLKANTKFLFKSMSLTNSASSVSTPFTTASFLFSSNDNFLWTDRKLSVHVPVQNCTDSLNYLYVQSINSIKKMTVTKNSIKNLFPIPKIKTFTVENRVISNLQTNKDSGTVQNNDIIGPDL